MYYMGDNPCSTASCTWVTRGYIPDASRVVAGKQRGGRATHAGKQRGGRATHIWIWKTKIFFFKDYPGEE